jgi:nucleoporin NUP159
VDTLKRTYRNIDIAIDQQERDVAELASRMARLNLTSVTNTTMTSKDLSELMRSRLNITPHVATTTAAALNAERSAQKLKHALISRRKPLLNASAASTLDIGAKKPDGLSLDPSIDSNWNSPKFQPVDTPSPPSSLPTRRTAGSGSKYHQKPILPKRSSPGQVAPAPNFDWGPLPSVTPMTNLSVDVRIKQ